MRRWFSGLLALAIGLTLLPLPFLTHWTWPNPAFVREQFSNFTFVSVPRPFHTEREYLLMKLAISNWISTSAQSRVILIVSDLFDPNRRLLNEIDTDFGPGRLFYQNTLEANRNGVPYIDNWFRSAVAVTPFHVLTLINADILLPSGWLSVIRRLVDIFGETAFVTGYRMNFDVNDDRFEELTKLKSFKGFDVDEFALSCPHEPYSHRGMDFFTFLNHPGTRFFELFPPFLMGKYEWDNWVMGKMYEGHQTISLGPDFRTYHCNHPETANKRWSQDSAYNKRLRILYLALSGDNRHTKWTLVNASAIIGRNNKVIYL